MTPPHSIPALPATQPSGLIHEHARAPRDGRIVIVSASVGAGHDGPADELGRRLHARGWWVDRPDGLRILPGRLGPDLRRLYLSGLRHVPALWGPVLDSCADGLGARAVHSALDRLTGRTLALLGDRPDAVVSTYPLVSQLLGRLRQAGVLAAPVISYLTDPAVHPLWWHPGVDLVLAPQASMAEQADRLARQACGESTRRVVVETATALPPTRCRNTEGRDIDAVRAELGVPAGRILALVTAGSAGTGQVHRTAADLAYWGAWPVVLCARNERLRRRVESLGVGRALGWVDDVPRILSAADVIVDNAGGLASAEAVAAGRAVISYRVLPGHGEANAAVLDIERIVPWARSRDDLGVLLGRGGHRTLGRRSALDDPAQIIHNAAVASRAGTPAVAG